MRRHFWFKWLRNSVLIMLFFLVSFIILDKLNPLPIQGFEDRTFAQLVVDAKGEPLRAFPDQQGVWRYPVTIDKVSPLYIEALITYEDRYFYQHFGVNPFSLIRAISQAVTNGRVVSGGSTITMQVARILEPHQKTIPGKLKQIFRALQLELHYSKQDILTFYLNYAPFGGTIEGVEAASFTYLGKPSFDLTHSEAALLAVLPQSPSRYRPDKNPETAKQARNKLLNRMVTYNVWDRTLVEELMEEEVWSNYYSKPMHAPLLSQRLKTQYPDQSVIATWIDSNMQTQLEMMLKDYIRDKEKGLSAAALIVDNKNLGVLAYVGTSDFANNNRAGFVDMIRATRSPGSTLKPFIYGLAIEQGIIHSESLLFDIPRSFEGYQPKNFNGHFVGPISASQALSRSLNMPAVQVLNEITPEFFMATLLNAGFTLSLPENAEPNLSLALGGGGASLEQLVSLYSAFANNGQVAQLRLTKSQAKHLRPFMDKGASWITQHMMSLAPLDKVTSNRFSGTYDLAYKTGTSYGARDTWVIAVTEQLTIGVWVGTPDGSFSVNNTGRDTAVPLLQMITGFLPKDSLQPIAKPDDVELATICWPLGTQANLQQNKHCLKKRSAYLLEGTAPPTLPDPLSKAVNSYVVTVKKNEQTGLQVFDSCADSGFVTEDIAIWPRSLEPWLPLSSRAQQILPKVMPGCEVGYNQHNLTISGIEHEATLYPEYHQTIEKIEFELIGAMGNTYVLLNNQLLSNSGLDKTHYQLTHLEPGEYQLIALDDSGNSSFLNFSIGQ